MQFQDIKIRFSIVNVQTERLVEENSWISSFTIYDHDKDELVNGVILADKFSEVDGNQGIILKYINKFLINSKVPAETNILYHDIYISSTLLTDEILETFCTNQSYLVFTNKFGVIRSVTIEKCIVKKSDLKNVETINTAFYDNSRFKLLDLEHATNIKNFKNYYEDFLKNVQVY